MCGRFALTLPPEIVRTTFGYADEPWFPPRFNIAPTQPIAVVATERVGGRSTRRSKLVRWGYVPAFVKDFNTFRPILNAWSEGVAEKPSFRNAFRRRRCLAMADGYYAWQAHEGGIQPWLIRRADRLPFGLGGLMEHWAGSDGSELDTACIVTAPADGAFARLHARRPVIVAPEDADLWLDPDETRSSEAVALLERLPNAPFEAVPVGSAVNKVANDTAAIQAPTGSSLSLTGSSPIRWQGGQGELF